MKSVAKKIRWIIQDNLIAENDLREIQTVCKDNDIDFFEVTVIPFLAELPTFPIDDEHINLYYGATTLMESIYWQYNQPEGLFFNHETFSMANYFNVWREHMLSWGGKLTTLGEFTKEDHEDDENWFLRPDADSKSFAGEVWKFKDIKNWKDRLTKVDNVDLNENTLIIASPAWNIKKEWRNYIVGGKIVTSSLYRKNFRLKKSSTDIPQEMLDFVEARIKEYQPHDIFCIDVCTCGDSYYIIECGCLNSCGFYAADIPTIILAVTNHFTNEKRFKTLDVSSKGC